jgi:uncharacterized protein (DUF1697 family)
MNIALVRGINVGGHKKVAMADLRGLFESLGFREVKSLLQSGNVVFTGGDRRTGAACERVLEGEAPVRLALQADFFVRTAKEWDGVVAGNPFPHHAKEDPGHLVLMCLKDVPEKASVKALQAAIVGPELVRADGRHLYIVFPDGMGSSRLTTALIERTLRTRGTARNWNTVLKLQSLTSAG